MILFVFFIDARNIVRLLYLAIFYMTFEMRTIYGINLLYSTAGQCENDADKTNMMDKMWYEIFDSRINCMYLSCYYMME